MIGSALKPSCITFHVRNGSIRCETWIPSDPIGLLILTHGTGSYRVNSDLPRITRMIYDKKIAVVAADFLSPEESADHRFRLNTELVSQRMLMLIQYLSELPVFNSLPVSLLGIGTGANAVLSVVTRIPKKIRSVAAVNGFTGERALMTDHFPLHIPTLILLQETLGHSSSSTIDLPLNKKNIQFRRLYRSDETIPTEGIEEAVEWLTKNTLRTAGPGLVRSRYELGPNR